MASNRAAPKSNPSAICFVVPQHVASRSFPTELVLLNLNTGQYHGLNPAGGRMFEVVEKCGGDLDAATSVLADEFDQPVETVRKDLHDLCAGLVERGLLEPTRP